MGFGPAQTTATSLRASSSRSAEMSKLVSAPRCTPPMPSVAKTRMPAIAATIIVAATVVAPRPSAPRPSRPRRCAQPVSRKGRSRRLTLVTAGPARPSRSICSADRPTCSQPSITAMVAGTAPWARTSACTASAVATFCGQGMPWLMMVDSSATTGRPAASAAATSGCSCSQRWAAGGRTRRSLKGRAAASGSPGRRRCARRCAGCGCGRGRRRHRRPGRRLASARRWSRR